MDGLCPAEGDLNDSRALASNKPVGAAEGKERERTRGTKWGGR